MLSLALCTHDTLGTITAEGRPDVVASSSIEARVVAANIGLMLAIRTSVTIHEVAGVRNTCITTTTWLLAAIAQDTFLS